MPQRVRRKENFFTDNYHNLIAASNLNSETLKAPIPLQVRNIRIPFPPLQFAIIFEIFADTLT